MAPVIAVFLEGAKYFSAHFADGMYLQDVLIPLYEVVVVVNDIIFHVIHRFMISRTTWGCISKPVVDFQGMSLAELGQSNGVKTKRLLARESME